MNITFVLVMVFIVMLLFIGVPHSYFANNSSRFCGPFLSYEEWYFPIEDGLDAGTAGYYVMKYLISDIALLWVVIALLLWYTIRL
jgi:Na+/H+ antiporter NhaC